MGIVTAPSSHKPLVLKVCELQQQPGGMVRETDIWQLSDSALSTWWLA